MRPVSFESTVTEVLAEIQGCKSSNVSIDNCQDIPEVPYIPRLMQTTALLEVPWVTEVPVGFC